MLNNLLAHWKTLLVAMVLLSASACGQKGDLYLPGEEQASAQTASLTYV